MTNLPHFIESAIMVLAVSCLAVGFFRRLGFGSILGLLAAGVALGPAGFKITESAEGLREFTELGIVFLLLVITCNDAVVAERSIYAFRWLASSSAPIVARLKDRPQERKLKAAGASHLVIEYDEISQRLIDSVCSILDLSNAAKQRDNVSHS